VLVVSDLHVGAWCVGCIEAEVRYIEVLDRGSPGFVDSFFIFTVHMAGVLYMGRPVSYLDDRFFGYLEQLLCEFDSELLAD